jgi:hypothetical protein
VVRPERLELPAYWFEASRSIQLSYGRTISMTCGRWNNFTYPLASGGPKFASEQFGTERKYNKNTSPATPSL